MKETCCETCRFWKSHGAAKTPGAPLRGACHRYAPRPSPHSAIQPFPETFHDSWCGEWLPAIATPDSDIKTNVVKSLKPYVNG